MVAPSADVTVLDREFAERWYRDGWLRAWNENRPELCAEILTDDFVLDSPTTRHTRSLVQGPQAAAEYIRYVLGAYPDLQWEVTDPPLYSDHWPGRRSTGAEPATSPAGSTRRGSRGRARRSSSRGSRSSTSVVTGPAISTRATTSSG
jgi:hypothetical protein